MQGRRAAIEGARVHHWLRASTKMGRALEFKVFRAIRKCKLMARNPGPSNESGIFICSVLA